MQTEHDHVVAALSSNATLQMAHKIAYDIFQHAQKKVRGKCLKTYIVCTAVNFCTLRI